MENPPLWWYLPGKMGIFMGEQLVSGRGPVFIAVWFDLHRVKGFDLEIIENSFRVASYDHWRSRGKSQHVLRTNCDCCNIQWGQACSLDESDGDSRPWRTVFAQWLAARELNEAQFFWLPEELDSWQTLKRVTRRCFHVFCRWIILEPQC